MATETRLNPSVQEAIAAALLTGGLPEMVWLTGDDKCDCTYQRIGMWTNPYLAETIEYRWCCIWKTILARMPDLKQFSRETPAFWDDNSASWKTDPQEWNVVLQPDDGPDVVGDMPIALWYRQLSRKTGRPLAEIRAEYSERTVERPKAKAWTKEWDTRHAKEAPNAEQVKRAKAARLQATGWIV